MIFKRNYAVRMDLSKQPNWAPLFSIPTLCKMFKDGHLFGKIAEHILESEFDNFTLAPEGGPFDILSSIGETIEVKSITKGGFDTSPSAMIGAGRKYDAVGHAVRINSIAENGYYILADNRCLPIVTFYPIAANEGLIFTNRNNNKTGKRTSLQTNVFIEELLNSAQLTIVDI